MGAVRPVTATLLGITFVLAIVAAIMAWGSTESSNGGFETEVHYGLFEVDSTVRSPGADSSGSFKWTEEELDDQDGVGLIRAGGPLFVVGIALVGAAFIVVLLDLFMEEWDLATWGSLGGGAATLFLLLGLILYPVGLARFTDGTDMTWSAGLFLGIAAAAAGVIAALEALAATKRS